MTELFGTRRLVDDLRIVAEVCRFHAQDSRGRAAGRRRERRRLWLRNTSTPAGCIPWKISINLPAATIWQRSPCRTTFRKSSTASNPPWNAPLGKHGDDQRFSVRRALLGAAPAFAPLSAYKWWVVGMLWLVCFFNYADRQSITSVLPILEKQFGFDGQARPDRLGIRLDLCGLRSALGRRRRSSLSQDGDLVRLRRVEHFHAGHRLVRHVGRLHRRAGPDGDGRDLVLPRRHVAAERLP